MSITDPNELSKSKKRQKRFEWSTLMMVLIILIVAGVQVLARLNERMGTPSGISIEAVILANQIDETGRLPRHTTQFSQTDRRIYCIIHGRGLWGLPLSTNLLVKWLYGSDEIRAHILYFQAGHPATVWLEPSDGEQFRPGHYSVEVFIQQTLVKTVSFEVK